MTPAFCQQAFWRDVWAERPQASAWTAQPGFAVYRNTVLKSCAEALAALYPALQRLAGDEWLQAVAIDFARAAPPTGGDLQHYGQGLPEFLATLPAAAGLPWLVDVARLDRLWSESHVAADGGALSLASMAALDLGKMADAALVPHPAARWRWCAQWPAFSLWQSAHQGDRDPNPPHWQGEGTLLTRPGGAVLAIAVDEAECALLDACDARLGIAPALLAVHTRFPATDLCAALNRLITQGAFAAITP